MRSTKQQSSQVHKLLLGLLLSCAGFILAACVAQAVDHQPVPQTPEAQARLKLGENIYRDGILPNGQTVAARVRGDIDVSGDQVKCSSCHRRSGLGSTEGQTAVPAVTGDILFSPLQLPTSKPSNAPILRPAYSRDALKRAITQGYGPKGMELDANMPRYNLNDEQLDLLIDYLSTLSNQIDPGVDEKNIYFATVTSDRTDPQARQAMMDVFSLFIKQKNTETRHESSRAENAPWHREWIFKPYRKWVLKEWVLKGDPSSWPQQLESYYDEQPVFAILSGSLPVSWAPVHNFCESRQLPCLFPTTDLPVISDSDFYTVYLDRGMVHEAEGIASQLLDSSDKVRTIQLTDETREESVVAAKRFAEIMTSNGLSVESIAISRDSDLSQIVDSATQPVNIITWLGKNETDQLLKRLAQDATQSTIYLSSTLYGSLMSDTPESLREQIRVVHTHELPSRLTRLLMRSTGWLRANRIYAPQHKALQANTYFSLKVAGEGLKHIRGYFYRDYLIEKVEKMVDNAPYTSIYPRISMAPTQRYIAKGFYMTKPSADGRNLVQLSDWKTPRVFR